MTNLMANLDSIFQSIKSRLEESEKAGHEMWYEDECGVRYFPPKPGSNILGCEPDGSFTMTFRIAPSSLTHSPDCYDSKEIAK